MERREEGRHKRAERDEGLKTAQSTNYRETQPAYCDITAIKMTSLRQFRQHHGHEGQVMVMQDVGGVSL